MGRRARSAEENSGGWKVVSNALHVGGQGADSPLGNEVERSYAKDLLSEEVYLKQGYGIEREKDGTQNSG